MRGCGTGGAPASSAHWGHLTSHEGRATQLSSSCLRSLVQVSASLAMSMAVVAFTSSSSLLIRTSNCIRFLPYRKFSGGKTPYQFKYDSFDHMINSEKSLARKLVLIEDKSPKPPPNFLHSLDLKHMSQLLDAKVDSVHYYSIHDRRMALVELNDYEHFQSKDSFLYADTSLPIKSRMVQLVSIPPHMKDVKVKDFEPVVHKIVPKKNSAIGTIPDTFAALGLASQTLSELGLKLRFLFLLHLEELICTGTFSQFKMLPFGSSVNGLGNDDSDLDIVMTPKEIEFNPKYFLMHLSRPILSERYRERCLTNLIGEHIKIFLPGIMSTQKIANARVPIIKLNSGLTGLESDVSFTSHCSGVSMARVIYQMCKLQPKFVQLYAFFKIWGRTKELIDLGFTMKFSNFMFLSILIAFMQLRSPPLLPPIHSVSPETKSEAEQIENVEHLIRNLFQFISDFDWKKSGISIWNGQIIPKPVHTDAMCIENPFESGHNVCRNIKDQILQDLIQCSRECLFQMKEEYPFSTLLKPRKVRKVITAASASNKRA